MKRPYLVFTLVLPLFFGIGNSFAQSSLSLKGFLDFDAAYNPNSKVTSFSLGEQDLFITSDITKNLSFLGESVIKFDATSSTHFAVSLERGIIKYNYYGNHSILFGKFHTPVNYWNDTYHHGRVFYPTIFRPEVFNSTIVPIHGAGVRLSGENLGKLKFGYDALISNGIGSMEVTDNNQAKSVCLAFHIKPVEGSRFGASFYNDFLSPGTMRPNGTMTMVPITQNIVTVSASYFKNNIELLTEHSAVMNQSTDTAVGTNLTHCYYGYIGYAIKDKYVPYFRFDYLEVPKKDIYFTPQFSNIYTFGFRYEISYLAVVKVEYQYKWSSTIKGNEVNNYYFQFAIGF